MTFLILFILLCFVIRQFMWVRNYIAGEPSYSSCACTLSIFVGLDIPFRLASSPSVQDQRSISTLFLICYYNTISSTLQCFIFISPLKVCKNYFINHILSFNLDKMIEIHLCHYRNDTLLSDWTTSLCWSKLLNGSLLLFSMLTTSAHSPTRVHITNPPIFGQQS